MFASAFNHRWRRRCVRRVRPWSRGSVITGAAASGSRRIAVTGTVNPAPEPVLVRFEH